MILQEEEKHNTEEKSSKRVLVPRGEQPASPPNRTDCLPASLQGTQEAHRDFLAMVAQEAEDEPYYSHTVFDEKELESIRKQEIVSSPRLVIRGAQSAIPTPPTPQLTIIDWLAFSTNETTEILKELISIFVPNVIFFPTGKGWQGYKNTIDINLFGKTIGFIAYGSHHGKNYFSLNGTGCRLIEDWNKITHYLRLLENIKLSRIDIAADYYYNEINKESIKSAFNEGKFKLPKARQNPFFDPREPTGGDGIPVGWTFYFGKRTDGKFCRIYHKGAEQFGKLDPKNQVEYCKIWEEIQVGDEFNAPESATFKNWVRVEIEYKSKDRVLDLDIINDRDNYFAGAYPYLEEILPMANPKRPKTLPNTLQTDIEIMFQNMSQQYGSFITTMLSSGMKPEEICKKIANGKQSQRLIKSGALEFIKPFEPSILAPQDEQDTK